jgi:hypothetical protein
MPISNPEQSMAQLISPNINKWKQSSPQTNCFAHYNDQQVIKPEPNRMGYSHRTSPQVINPTSISASVIRISPVITRMANNSQNFDISWPKQNIQKTSTGTEQHAIILQNALTSVKNCSSLSNIPGSRISSCQRSCKSPIRNITLPKEHNDESVDCIQSSAIQTNESIYVNNRQAETNFLVINNSDTPIINKVLQEEQYQINIDNLLVAQPNTYQVTEKRKQLHSSNCMENQSINISDSLIQSNNNISMYQVIRLFLLLLLNIISIAIITRI